MTYVVKKIEDMSNKQDTSLFRKDLFVQALKDSFIKLNPVLLIKNPVIFIVGIGSVLTTITVISGIFPEHSPLSISRLQYGCGLLCYLPIFRSNC